MAWEDEIGAPAEKSKEGEQSLIDNEFGTCAYELAPLAKGWAVRVECGYKCGDRHRCWVPWHRFDSRDECLDFVMEQSRFHFEFPVVCPEQQGAQTAMLQLLAGMEGIVDADVRVDPPAKSHVERIKRQEAGQGLLF
jgi:hypothetical protein